MISRRCPEEGIHCRRIYRLILPAANYRQAVPAATGDEATSAATGNGEARLQSVSPITASSLAHDPAGPAPNTNSWNPEGAAPARIRLACHAI